MSDETPPPPLRLKPRQRDESEEPPATAAAEEGKLRLRPKLNLEPAEPAPAEPEPSPPAEGERIRLKPKLTPEPEAEVTETPAEPAPEPEEEAPPPPPPPEEGRIKLKIKLPGSVVQETLNPPVETIPPTEEAMTEPPVLPPFPVVAPPPPEEEELEAPPLIAPVAGRPPVPPIPTDGSRPSVFKRPRVPAALLAAERRKRMWKYALIAVGGVVLAGAVIFGAFLKFSEPLPPIHIPPRERPPLPQAVVPAPIPDKLATKPKIEPVVPNEAGFGPRVDSTATIELTPGVLATTESVKAVPNASSAFRTFVASAKVSGVYQGNPPRAFINGRLVRAGETVDEVMEIHFDSVDPATRSIIFKDSTGATVSRRY